LEELESRNLLSILGLQATVAMTISLEPSANANVSLASTVQPSSSVAPVAVSAFGQLVAKEATAHAGAGLDVSLGRILTGHAEVVTHTPPVVQTVQQTVNTVLQDVNQIVSPIVNPELPSVVPPIISEPAPVVPPISVPVIPPVSVEPPPVVPAVTVPAVSVVPPAEGPGNPSVPVLTTGSTPITQPATAVAAANSGSTSSVPPTGTTVLPPNQTQQVESAGVADTGGVPVDTVPLLAPSALAETSAWRVESGGGDDSTPIDWLTPMTRIEEGALVPKAGRENDTTKAPTAEAIQACDSCFLRETAKPAATEQGDTLSETAGLAWMLDPGTAIAALALAVGGFEWGFHSDETARRNRRLVQI